MSNDWWTSSSSSTPQQPFHTPQRPGQFQLQNSTSRSTRFSSNNVGDELDSEDLKMADSIKFLPSFANSPAGKLALGTSPQNSMSPSAGFGGGGGNMGMGMGMGGVGSPNEGRRSPGVRERVERDSPRHHRRSLLHQNSQLGSSSAFGGGMAIDEDMPPTASLRDSINENGNGAMQIRNNEVNNAVDLPTPSTLLPSQTTTSLHIFGPPLPILASLQPYLSQFGPISSYTPGPEGSNWYIVQYSNPVSASYALRRHGDILQGKYMIGFKVVNETSQNGFTQSPGQGQGPITHSQGGGAGTPIRVQAGKSIVKPRAAPVKKVTSAGANGGGNEYNWDDTEEEQKNGWGGWVSERLFGR